jgi:hypothetical protein
LKSQPFPKSTVGLRSGDFCFVPRIDGRVALLVYLYRRGNSRSYFLGALAQQLLSAPHINKVPSRLELLEQALLHIKCFKENDTPIAGNILDRIDSAALSAMHAAAHATGVGSAHLVWGYRTIVRKANDIAA